MDDPFCLPGLPGPLLSTVTGSPGDSTGIRSLWLTARPHAEDLSPDWAMIIGLESCSGLCE